MITPQNVTTVSYRRKEYVAMQRSYRRIRDCLDGEDAVKAKQTTYLPMPNLSFSAEENMARYQAYLTRASFYNATKSTLKGLHGQIFMREPEVSLPSQMEYLLSDASGNGVGLVQLAKRACLENLALGRGGFLVDYPDTGGMGASQVAIDEGLARPYIYFYTAEQIINWRTEVVGASRVVTLLVLEEEYDYVEGDYGFDVKTGTMWRILTLEGGIYRSQVVLAPYAATARNILPKVTPTDASGETFNRIPFFFVGSENNDSDIDDPPLDDIATLNIAHYRNSADYEDSCFFAGQPTPVFTGLTQSWVDENMSEGVLLGARAAVQLPENANAFYMQPTPNSMPFEAMKHKEKQMVALGAKLVEQPGVVRTASEAEISFTSENSVLSNVALNVASSMNGALQIAARFVGVATDQIKFILNTDFDLANMSPEKLRQVVEAWQKGSMSFEEIRGVLRKASLARLPDEEASRLINTEMQQRAAQVTQDNPSTQENSDGT